MNQIIKKVTKLNATCFLSNYLKKEHLSALSANSLPHPPSPFSQGRRG